MEKSLKHIFRGSGLYFEYPIDIESREEDRQMLFAIKNLAFYKIEAADGEIGHVEDFIADFDHWILRYFVVDRRDRLPGKNVIISPHWIQEISWTGSRVVVSMTKNSIKNSPEYDPSAPVDIEYESRLYNYYAKPKYWK